MTDHRPFLRKSPCLTYPSCASRSEESWPRGNKWIRIISLSLVLPFKSCQKIRACSQDRSLTSTTWRVLLAVVQTASVTALLESMKTLLSMLRVWDLPSQPSTSVYLQELLGQVLTTLSHHSSCMAGPLPAIPKHWFTEALLTTNMWKRKRQSYLDLGSTKLKTAGRGKNSSSITLVESKACGFRSLQEIIKPTKPCLWQNASWKQAWGLTSCSRQILTQRAALT